MIRLWVSGAECVVPQDMEVEFTFNTADADGLEVQSSNYSTGFALPVTPENIAIFTPLFDIRTVFGSASFDIHANAPAIMEINGHSVRGYVKMESVDSEYHLRFINGLGQLLEKLRSTRLADLSLIAVPSNVVTAWSQTYDVVYVGSGIPSTYAIYTFFPAFSDNESTHDGYVFTTDSEGTGISGRFPYRYKAENGSWQTGYYSLTNIQAKAYNRSGLRVAMQMQYLFRQVLSQSGFTADYSTGFFKDTNPYWKNLFMTLRQRVGTTENPVSLAASEWVPDMTCEDFILGYCKMFGLRIVVNGTNVQFLLRAEYYQTGTSIDLAEGIDREAGITVTPNPYFAQEYSCGLDLDGGDGATYGRALRDAVNIYDGVPFRYAAMMQYQGPRVSWIYNANGYYKAASNVVAGGVTLPFISDDAGGELLFRFNNVQLEGNGFIFNDDDLNDPYDGITSIGTKVTSRPEITALNDAAPLYAESSSIKYNYTFDKAVNRQHFFEDFFKPYFDEIRSGDNVMLSCEGVFTPDVIERLSQCKAMVMIDGVRCRIIECVTNFVDRCKLTLQKINDEDNLVAGQGFDGYYLKGANNETDPYLYIPTSTAIGSSFPLPIITNDTIVSVSTSSFQGYLSVTATGVSVLQSLTPLEYKETIGNIVDAYRPQYGKVTVTTAHGLSIIFRIAVYKEDHALDYYPDDFKLTGQGIRQSFRPTLREMPDGAVLALYDADGNVWSGSNYATITLRQDGVLTVTPKVASIPYGYLECIVVAKQQASAHFFATTVVIDFEL